ncbi:MAG: lytic transglycosylase domain-containing protein, partial [Candidatus Puniceispirillaceae bacterium]
MIVNEARKTTHVTPSVALAVAKIESGFRPHVVSSAGAIGVMQIMPRTGRDVFGLNRTELFDPAVNIRAGVTFLNQLIERYDGRIDLALSHYNGGSRV